MNSFYRTIEAEFNRCPPDCMRCAEACKEVCGDKGALIEPIHIPKENFHAVLICSQCSLPKCLEACPTGAITKSPDDGTVQINDEKCMGCGLCDLNCPYGGIHYREEMKKSFNCDMCQGTPQCVEACQAGVLKSFDGQRVMDDLGDEDVITPGTPLCAGCSMETTLRLAMKVFGRDTFLFGCAGCAGSLIASFENQTTTLCPSTLTLMTNVPSVMTGVKRYYRTQGKDVRCVCFVGDGATVDVGFQPLSGAAERNENLIYICYDNEAYMNTGIQRSGSTPLHGWTFTTPTDDRQSGKEMPPKYMPLIMLEHNIAYVATASIGHPQDYVRKLRKAMTVKDGLSYIHVLTPCPTGWRHAPETSIHVSRMAVETNYWPLWEAEKGNVELTYANPNPRPMRDFVSLQRRFAHFNDELMADFEKTAMKRYDRIVHLSIIDQ